MEKLNNFVAKTEKKEINSMAKEILAIPEVMELVKKNHLVPDKLSFFELCQLEKVVLSTQCQCDCPGVKTCPRSKLIAKIAATNPLNFVSEPCPQLVKDLKQRNSFLFDNSNGFEDVFLEPEKINALCKRLVTTVFVSDSGNLEDLNCGFYKALQVKALTNTVAYLDLSTIKKSLKDYDLESIANCLSEADILVITNIGKGTINSDIRDVLLLPVLSFRQTSSKTTLLLTLYTGVALKPYFLFANEFINDVRITRALRLIEEFARN